MQTNSTWSMVSLGDGMMAPALCQEIENAFARLPHTNPGMAVFTRHESEGRLHCEVIAYFSAPARELGQQFDATPCPPPARAGLGLLAGDPDCWQTLFPGQA